MLSRSASLDILSGRRRGIVAACLRGTLAAAEPLYGWFIRRRNGRYNRGALPITRVEAPVISVGNLTVGGTGKTPLVCWLAKWFQSRGIPVTLISRGYGKSQGPNDEALELEAKLPSVPHLQNPDRVAAAAQSLAKNPRQILILDDAFQHRRIARDLDIVLLDALEPFGYGRLLPRGLLREPVEGLARAHVVGLSRADAIVPSRREQIRQEVARRAPQAAWLKLTHRPAGWINASGQKLPLEALRGEGVLAFCGIGNPAGLAHSLWSAGVKTVALREFPDHHAYTNRDFTELGDWCSRQSAAAAIVCTHKDLVKIPRERMGTLPLWALAVEMEISAGGERLQSYLEELAARVR
ncbi:MAG TPA: tetraacyldisaccharide 4'-kinase [Pirellulaceae bacterium]|nr:tetraacyldisaccharide 4'-kinase [Pirellulaceae bacterium]